MPRKFYLLVFLNLIAYSCGLSLMERPHGELPRPHGEQEASVSGPSSDGSGKLDSGASSERLWRQAKTLWASGAPDAAAEKLRLYLKSAPWGPHAPDALMTLADIYEKKGQISASVPMYRQVLERFSDYERVPEARRKLMQSLYFLKRYDEILLLAPDPSNPEDVSTGAAEDFETLGDALREIGDLPAAAQAYATACVNASDPLLPEVSRKLLKVLDQVRPVEILSLVDRFDTDPPRGDLLFALGMAYKRAGDTAGVQAVLSTFLDLYPAHPMAESARAELPERSQVQALGGEVMTVGVLLPLSGRMERFGRQALRGIEIAISRFSGKNPSRKVSLMVQNTTSETESAKSSVDALASGGALAVIGPLFTAETAAEAAQRYRIPIITLTQKDEIVDIGDCVFRNFLSPKQQVEHLTLHAIRRLGLLRFGVLYPNEKYGTTFLALFSESVSSLGGSIAQSVAYQPSDTDFNAPIRKLLETPGGFDALFIPDAPPKIGLILPQLAQNDLGNMTFLGTNLWHDHRLIEMAGKFAAGAIIPDGFFPDGPSPRVREFADSFRLAYGETPGFLEAVAYDSAMMVLELIGRGASTPEQIRKGLYQMGTYEGVTGATRFNSQGDAVKNLTLLRIEGERFVELATP